MSGGGGSQTVKKEIPEWQRKGAEGAIKHAEYQGDRPNMPYRGMVQAANLQQPSMTKNLGDMAKAYGLAFNADPRAGRPPPERNAQGMLGYSTGDMFDDEMERLGKAYPGLLDYIKSLSIDPVTGEPGSRTYAAGRDDDDADSSSKGPRAVGNGKEFYEPGKDEVVDRDGRFIRQADYEDRDLPRPPESAYRWA